MTLFGNTTQIVTTISRMMEEKARNSITKINVPTFYTESIWLTLLKRLVNKILRQLLLKNNSKNKKSKLLNRESIIRLLIMSENDIESKRDKNLNKVNQLSCRMKRLMTKLLSLI